ncbi:MAG TPA: glycosyltransferase [Streptosporangiaceae bacterium]|nr:glycosyltransferase [Streptosporangiaceae bacterium]
MPAAIATLLALTALTVLAWIYLLAGHGGFWRTGHRLPASRQRPDPWPSVTAVIPARDEAVILPQTLPTLLTQDYPGRLTVILVDDESTDGTAETAAALDCAGPGGRPPGSPREDGRLKVIGGSPTPPGWAGKVWAMQQGLDAATDTDYILFTDADIGYAQGTLARLVESAGDRALVSQMALLRCESAAERLLIPAFVYFFAQLYPFRRVSSSRDKTAAAAGGCMLVRREALLKAGGLGEISGARIDDVALGTLLKRAGHDTWLGFTTDVTSRRPYDFTQVWNMVARSAYTQLSYSPALLVGTVIGLAWLYLLPPAATVAGLALLPSPPAIALAALGTAAWTLMSITYLPMLRLNRLNPLRAPTLPLIAALYVGMTISSAGRHRRGQGGEWKGRYSNASDTAHSNASGGGQEQTRLRSP